MSFDYLAVFSLCCLIYIWWGAAVLPKESWQFAAAIPVTKNRDDSWEGVNLTWYGILTANAYVASVSVLIFLLGALGLSPISIMGVAVAMLLVCVPAASVVARIVEKKKHTLTVGGAVFVGTITAPFVIFALNKVSGITDWRFPMLPTLAAFAIAYTFGEGLGRLACLSFGCCYGKELNSCSQPVRRLLHPFAPVFTGTTKKISYAGGASGVKVVPVQLMTCVLHVIVGITAIYLFSIDLFGASLVLAITITQGWRFASELLRADYRGAGNFSAYQFMGLAAIVYTWLELLIPVGAPMLFSAKEGFDSFWSPQIILSLQSIWVAILLYTGLSKVTSSQVTFSIRRERI